jgi:rod shape-determining protein MreC
MALKIPTEKLKFGGQLGGKALLVVLLVVSLATLVLYVREGNEGFLHSAQNTTSALSSPFSAVGTTVGSLAATATTSVEDLTADDATLSQARENNATLRQMVVELEEYRQEAERLEKLIGLSDAYGFESVAAHVVGYSADSYNRVITLDVGSNSGVKVGQPVMGSTGVIGQVISTTGGTCKVRLLTDAQSGISVLVQSSRAEGILTGSVEGTLYLDGVDIGTEVKEGDAIITAGLGGGYYRGLVVGVVSKVEQSQGDATRTIVIAPNADFSNISEVLVVLGMGKADATQDASLVEKVDPDALSAPDAAASGEANGSNGNSNVEGPDGNSDSEGSDSSEGGEN